MAINRSTNRMDVRLPDGRLEQRPIDYAEQLSRGFYRYVPVTSEEEHLIWVVGSDVPTVVRTGR